MHPHSAKWNNPSVISRMLNQWLWAVILLVEWKNTSYVGFIFQVFISIMNSSWGKKKRESMKCSLENMSWGQKGVGAGNMKYYRMLCLVLRKILLLTAGCSGKETLVWKWHLRPWQKGQHQSPWKGNYQSKVLQGFFPRFRQNIGKYDLTLKICF